MPLDVVAIFQQGNLGLVGNGVRLEAFDARLHHAAESWADLNAVGEGAIGKHGGILLA